MSPRIPVYLSHSYWPEDREINCALWELFWQKGFAFTVDPKSSQQLPIPHLELMMRRSAAFVAIAPYRPDQDHYKTSPYIVFEHNMAVRANRPRLVIAESRVAGRPFEASPSCVFQRDDPTGGRSLPRLIDELKMQSRPLAVNAGQLLGSVGLVLPASRPYQAVRNAIGNLLESAGYKVRELAFDRNREPDVAEIDEHDFVVIDTGARAITSGLYYRFVPAIRLAHRQADGRKVVLPSTFVDPALARAGASAQHVICWSTIDQLLAQLQPIVDKIQRPRRQFRTYEEGIGYFRSLGRARQGPVFISNAKRQNDVALQLSRALDLNNIAFFHYQYKNSIPMGRVWEGELLQRVRSSSLFIALVSAEYRDSELCQRELQLAQQLAGQNRLLIYRYFLDGTPDVGGGTELLQGRDLAELPLDDQVGSILADIDKYLRMGEHKAS